MADQIPAHIMVPSEGEIVLCWGLDSHGQPFSAVPGARINGAWRLADQVIILGIVISWQYPKGRDRPGLNQDPGSTQMS
ncbi:MAG: hypothetical protein U0996_01390 [Planctomycetaceae bacterium]